MISLNTQPPEEFVTTSDGRLEVVSIFSTIQGEGPFAGEPAVFLRLAGCNLKCPSCDTDYTSSREGMSIAEIVDSVVDLGLRYKPLLVITGGEPFRQNIGPLIRQAVMFHGLRVQVETNGTLHRHDVLYDEVSIVCSPKTPSIHPHLIPHINAFKYILSADRVDPCDGLPTESLGYRMTPARPPEGFRKQNVYVQPLDTGDVEENKRHSQAALASCLAHGYRLSLQLHKQLGLP